MRGRIAWKRRIGQLYAFMRARDARRKLILLYHSVGGSTEATAKDAFRDQLGVIAAMGQLLPLQEVLGSAPNKGIAVAVTFDDGYATLRDHAATILTEFGGAATVFLNVSEIADDERRASRAADGYYPHEQFLAWRDVDALVAAGWHIGSHGVHHLDLVRADTSTSRHEVTASKQTIERRLGMPCDLFAYPWGRNGPGLRAQVRAAGYRYGFAGDHSPLTATSDPFALPRINVANGYSRNDLAAILRGDWDYLYWLVRAKAVMG
jgi:peptidoglycan/xylan/chitin deacetylase (PgdA/CDA1 family)